MCNEHATQRIAVGCAKSLTAKQMSRFLRCAAFQEIFLRHDLDDTVKSPPAMPGRANARWGVRGLCLSLPLKTRRIPNPELKVLIGNTDASLRP
jgi:hypothetical protein